MLGAIAGHDPRDADLTGNRLRRASCSALDEVDDLPHLADPAMRLGPGSVG